MKLEREFIAQIQAHKGMINKLLFLYATGAEEREDLRQEILLAAWKSYPKFRGEAKFSTWLYKIGINVAMTLMKKKNKAEQTKEISLADRPNLTSIYSSDLLEFILKQFHEVDKAIILLLEEGYSQAEIAGLLGITAENVRVKVSRIRKKLRKNGIEGYLGE